MRILFLDTMAGISGDMTVGALCDLGVKPSTLEWELAKLDIGDFHMHFDRQQRHAIEGVKFGIHEGAHHHHGQDEEPSHGHEKHGHHDCQCGHHHEEGHGHDHHHHDGDCAAHSHEHHEHGNHGGHHHHHDGEACEHHAHGHHHGHGEHTHHDCQCGHDHSHEEHAHGHSHDHHAHAHGRTHAQIRELIGSSGLSPFVKEHALSIFHRVAVAEAKIHGMTVENVAFHEVGALDSIADIVCACVGIEALGVEAVHAAPLFEGRGWVDCAHGRFPVPAPATLEILTGIPLRQVDEPYEYITPTGAAIVAEFAQSFGPMPAMTIEKIGYGIGSRDQKERPNVLRAVLGTAVEEGDDGLKKKAVTPGKA